MLGSRAFFVGAAALVGLGLAHQTLGEAPAVVSMGELRVDSPDGLASGSGSASSSIAGNFAEETHLTVNERTGAVALDFPIFHLQGIRDDLSANLVLSYHGDDAITDFESNRSVFGLPPGWKLNLTYIFSSGGPAQINVDGTQTYVYDSTWTTEFAPVGYPGTVPIKTGLKEYNRADTQFRAPDPNPVTVGGITSGSVLYTVDGRARHLSPNGLLLEDRDRWSNRVQYYYNGDVVASEARLEKIVDTWGNEVLLSYCESGSSGCTPGDVTVTLPDGRTVGWSFADATTRILDAQGKATLLSWGTACGGYPVLTGITGATGGATALSYQCMDLCTESTAPSECTGSSTKQWPVVATRVDCPTYESGTSCSASAVGDALTTRYAIGGTQSQGSLGPNNYTGYPYYSPYDVPDPAADSLMQTGDGAFHYGTATSKLHGNGTEAVRTTRQYNFLHLAMEEASYVSTPNGGSTLSRATSHCYDLGGNAADPSCLTPTSVNYRALPANYQSPVTSGSCVFAVTESDTPGARLSITTREYDGFGQTINLRRFHGTTSTGIVSKDCDRLTRLDPGPLQLAFDLYLEHDAPSSATDSYLNMGPGSGHYGLLTGALAFIYPDVDDERPAAALAATDSSTPTRVVLTCTTPDSAGLNVEKEILGALGTETEPPEVPGIVDACDSPAWDISIEPPKQREFTYDPQGRVLTDLVSWGAGSRPGITDRLTTRSYTLGQSTEGEESCGKVLETVRTDDNGNSDTTRLCTGNGFLLSKTDARGQRVTYTHDAVGLVTRTTNPNGTYKSSEFYYACPRGPEGHPTCPSSSTAATPCPYDTNSPARNCTVNKLHEGTAPNTGEPNGSYADGIATVDVRDGLGRTVAVFDNLGTTGGGGYTSFQQRSSVAYDDLGLKVSQVSRIGLDDPLIYETRTEYGPKYRPDLACGPRGVASEVVHDDVGQHVKRLINGHAHTQTSYNDRHKDTRHEDCPIGTTVPTAGSSCSTVASDTSSAQCDGDGYMTYIALDGSDANQGITALDPNASANGASVASVSSRPTYSADLRKYAYDVQGTTVDGSGNVSSSASWARDLNGNPLLHQLTVDSQNVVFTASSDTYEYDGVGKTLSAANNLGFLLTEEYGYSPTYRPESHQDYAGVEFHSYYDAMDRLVRTCYPSESGGSEGETYERDPITGATLKVAHFRNDGPCSACAGNDCGDQIDSAIEFTYVPGLGQVESKTYMEMVDGVPSYTTLEWAYDAYQRQTCFADAEAVAAGHGCPDSPTAPGWAPEPSAQLTWYVYWPDSDTYRRGLLQSICRGIATDASGLNFVTKCVDTDYYISVDTDGACDSVPSATNVTGAFAGLVKTSYVCRGGSCLAGLGTQIYETRYEYDAHRRRCSTRYTNGSGDLILGSSYRYDQYGKVISESHDSELDPTDASNFSMSYVYDGLLRLIETERTDKGGDPIESVAYKYDARSNLIQKVETVYSDDAVACPDAPEPACETGFDKVRLTVHERSSGKAKLHASFSGGVPIALDKLGDPVGSDTSYALCLYADGRELSAELSIDRAGETCGTKPCWRATPNGSPSKRTGYLYQDAEASASGVRRMALRSGTERQSKIEIRAAHASSRGQLALPDGIADVLRGADELDVQFLTSEGACFGATLSEIRERKSNQFLAQ